ncbi:glycosyltransferase family 39 protein [Candidatus Latescibacterota bacterium]
MGKKQTAATSQKLPGIRKNHDFLSYLDSVLEKHETWLSWSIVSAFFLVMSFLTLRYHTTGGFGVETDFYAELAYQAQLLLRGDFSPMNYGAKGPVYSLILAGVSLVVRDLFVSGLLINLISGFTFLIVLFYLVKQIFNRITAFVVILAVAFNFSFQSYIYQAGSDLPFMALSILSIFFLYRSEKRKYLVLSAVFGLFAFLTRYNGAFIAFGSMLYLAFSGGTAKERLKRIGLWTAVYICLGLPWFIPNYIVRGNPVYNSNYINVMIDFYGIGKEGFSVETWYDRLPDKFNSLGDVILYDPVHFITHLSANIITHFLLDIQKLIGLGLGIFTVLGIPMLFIVKPSRKMLLYFSFGIFYFLILTLVFYNARFSLFLITLYLPLAVWPFTEKKVSKYLRKFSGVPVILIFTMTLYSGYTSSKVTVYDIKNVNPLLEELKIIGENLDKIEVDKSQKILARKPNTAHYAGLTPIMFPEDVDTVEKLIDYCNEIKARYILYSATEYEIRPKMRILYDKNYEHPGLERVFYNRAGFVYRVRGI